jgi:hypothetical protein
MIDNFASSIEVLSNRKRLKLLGTLLQRPLSAVHESYSSDPLAFYCALDIYIYIENLRL